MKKTTLDAIDIRILAAVQSHGQLSKTRLAEIVNLSPTPCWARLDRLKSAGYIRSYHAVIAMNRIIDLTQVLVTVALQRHRKQDFDRFEAYVRNVSEITECFATGGGIDYVLKVVVPCMSAFQSVIDGLLAEDLNIDRYYTYIVTREIKVSQPDLAKLAKPAQASHQFPA